MRFIRTHNDISWDFGIYITNWGHPIANEWEVGINFGRWSFGIELYR